MCDLNPHCAYCNGIYIVSKRSEYIFKARNSWTGNNQKSLKIRMLTVRPYILPEIHKYNGKIKKVPIKGPEILTAHVGHFIKFQQTFVSVFYLPRSKKKL